MRSVLLISCACGIFGTTNVSAWAFDDEPGSPPEIAPRSMRVDMKPIDSKSSAAELGRKQEAAQPAQDDSGPSNGERRTNLKQFEPVLPEKSSAYWRIRHLTAKRFPRPFSSKTNAQIQTEVTAICRELGHCDQDNLGVSHLDTLEVFAEKARKANEERRERTLKTSELLSIDERTTKIDELRDRLYLLKWQISDTQEFSKPDSVYKSPARGWQNLQDAPMIQQPFPLPQPINFRE